MFGHYLQKTKHFDMQFHLIVASSVLKTCVKDHGDSSSRLLEIRVSLYTYRSALASGFVNILVFFNKLTNNF